MHYVAIKHGMLGGITLKTFRTMEQKITWMHYLIVGITICALSSISGCDKGEIDQIQQAEYVYINKLTKSLRFELYNSDFRSSYEFVLKSKDSITFVVSGTPVAFPFADNEIQSRTGDSVVFQFEGGKCIHYIRNKNSGTFGGDGVFNFEDYENYTLKMVGEKKYRLIYHINAKDFQRSINCE